MWATIETKVTFCFLSKYQLCSTDVKWEVNNLGQSSSQVTQIVWHKETIMKFVGNTFNNKMFIDFLISLLGPNKKCFFGAAKNLKYSVLSVHKEKLLRSPTFFFLLSTF